jgi:hypothetical protein
MAEALFSWDEGTIKFFGMGALARSTPFIGHRSPEFQPVKLYQIGTTGAPGSRTIISSSSRGRCAHEFMVEKAICGLT